jgi:hypothetical protein
MKADSWILRDLPKLLVDDWYKLLISTEFDVQVAAYHHLRKAYDRDRHLQWRIRAQPLLKVRGGEVKPDIVIYKGTILYDVIEIKCLLDGFSWTRIEQDLKKFRTLQTSEGLRHAYMLVVYDDDVVAGLQGRDKDPWMKNFLTFVGANVRRSATGRLRAHYASTRRRWTKYYR